MGSEPVRESMISHPAGIETRLHPGPMARDFNVLNQLDLDRIDSRRFQDRDGGYWTVYERPAAIDPVPIPRSLVFDSLLVVRRVRGFPDNWATFDAAALERLSWQR